MVHLPAPGETVNGDAWRICEEDGGLAVIVADGLGHGPDAAAASDRAVSDFAVAALASLDQWFRHLHTRLRGTRGAAVAVAHLGADRSSLRYAGIGNIAGHLCGQGPASGRGLVSHNGTVGVEMPRVQAFDYPVSGRALLIMHSDGLRTRWSLDAYPGLAQRHPAVIAAVLYRDFLRGRDDVTVCVVRCGGPPGPGSGADG